jgi:hypothetical protein
MALARASDDPALKQHYQKLALKFVQNAASEPDPDNTGALLAIEIAATSNRHGR